MSFSADKKINEITFDGDEREALLKAAQNYLRFIEQSSNFFAKEARNPRWIELLEISEQSVSYHFVGSAGKRMVKNGM